MDEKAWYAVSLCIRSKSKTVEEIAAQVGMQPTRGHNIGEPVSRRNPTGNLHTESLWVMDSNLSNESNMENHMRDIFKKLNENNVRIPIHIDDCLVEFFCGYSSERGLGELELSHSILSEISALGAALTVFIYP